MSVRKWIFLAAATVVVLAIVVAVVALFFLRSLSRPGEATAKFMPDDAPLYVSFNFRPGPNQINLGKDVISLLKTDKLIEVRDDFLEDVEDETGVHLLDDTQSWLGTDVSFALLDDDVESPTWVMIAQVGDEDAALDFIDDLVSYIEDETGVDIDGSTYRDTDLWVAEDDSIAFGLTAEYLIAGDRENTVTRILRDIALPPERSLAQHPDFIAAQESMPEDRVMFLFAQTEDLQDLIVDNVDLVDTGTALDSIRDNIPNYVAASASFIEKGMSLEIVADIPDGASDLSLGSGILSPDALPADTLLMLAGTGITQGWDEGLDTLQDSDLEAYEAFEQALDDLEDETGIDAERDIIDSLSGEIAFALLPSDIKFEGDGATSGAVEALFLAGVNDPQSIRRALETAIDRIDDSSRNNIPPSWTTVTKEVVLGIPQNYSTEISLQRASNLAYSQRILDLDGNPIPESEIYLSRDMEIVFQTEPVTDPATQISLTKAMAFAETGRLLAPFEDRLLSVTDAQQLGRSDIKAIYAVVANPDLQIAQSDAVMAAGSGALFDLSGSPLSRAQVANPSALGMEVQVMVVPTLVRVSRAEPLIVQELRPPPRSGDSVVMDDPTVRVDRLELNGYEAVRISIDELELPVDIEPAYVVTEDWAALGSTLESLERFHTAASGTTDSLRFATKFADISDDLPGPLHFITFADITGIADMVEEALTGDTRRDYRKEVKPFLEPFSALLLAYSVTDEEFRLTMRVSLQES